MGLALQLGIAALLILSVPLAVIDIREHRLPNPFTFAAAIAAFAATAIASTISGDWPRFWTATLVNFAVAGLGIALVYSQSFGMGDVKLLISLNQILGYFSPWLVLVSLVIALFGSTLVGGIRLLAGKMKLKDRIAFGPFLILGYAVCAVPLAIEPTLY